MPRMKVTYRGKTYELGEPTFRVLVDFEREFDVPVAALEREQRLEHMTWLVWAIMRHERVLDPGVSFDADFLDGIEWIEIDEKPALSDLEGEPEGEREGNPVGVSQS